MSCKRLPEIVVLRIGLIFTSGVKISLSLLYRMPCYKGVMKQPYHITEQ